MHRFRLFGLALIVLFALGIVMSGVAFGANPASWLPTTGVNFTELQLKSPTAEFLIKGVTSTVICKKAELGPGGGKTEGEDSGKIDILFLECKSGEANCKGLHDETAGSILAESTIDLRVHTKEPTLTALVALLVPELHFTCGVILFLVKGCVAGLITPVKTKTKHLEITFKQKEDNQEPLEIFNLTATAKEKCELTGTTTGAEFKPAAELVTALILTEEIEIMV